MTYIWMCKDILLYASLGKVKNIKYPVILIERPDVWIIITDHLCLLNTCIITTKHNKTLSWWRHQMETFSALLTLCAGNSPVSGEFPSQRPVTRSFDVFFDLRLYKRLSKHSWGWWFETLSSSLWRHRNVQILWRSVVVEENNKTIRAFPLKRKCCHFDEILITDCTESCHFDNFRCSQWLKFRQNDDISVSVSPPFSWLKEWKAIHEITSNDPVGYDTVVITTSTLLGHQQTQC